MLIVILLRFAINIFLNNDYKTEARIEYILLPESEAVKPADTSYLYFTKNSENANLTKTPEVSYALFNFDPNRLDSTGWVRLGLSPRQTAALLKYRNKGGRFRKPDDLARLRVISPEFYERVKPYIIIEKKVYEASPTADILQKKQPEGIQSSGNIIRQLDLNTASAEELAGLPGLTLPVAAAIVRYRDRVQGFDSLEQLLRLRGITPALLSRLKPHLTLSAPQRVKINLNYATEEEMTQLPGIGAYRAGLIRRSRLKDGFFRSFSDFRNRNLLPDSVLRLLENRVEF